MLINIYNLRYVQTRSLCHESDRPLRVINNSGVGSVDRFCFFFTSKRVAAVEDLLLLLLLSWFILCCCCAGLFEFSFLSLSFCLRFSMTIDKGELKAKQLVVLFLFAKYSFFCLEKGIRAA